MKTSLTKGLDVEKTKELKVEFASSTFLRERLRQLLDEKIQTNRTATTSKDAYGNPNWAYLQADAVGYERALKEVISLLE
jgi:hypothetical protein